VDNHRSDDWNIHHRMGGGIVVLVGRHPRVGVWRSLYHSRRLYAVGHDACQRKIRKI